MRQHLLSAEALGHIMLARLLEMPLATYWRAIRDLEAGAEFARLGDAVHIGQLPGCTVAEDPVGPTPRLLGDLIFTADRPKLVYATSLFVREYRFHEAALAGLQEATCGAALRRAVYRMRLVNTRNRLSVALAEYLLDAQADYLVCRDAAALRPLPHRELVRRLRAAGNSLADPARLSRLLPRLSVALPGGRILPLADLTPRSRQVRRSHLESILRCECRLLATGRLEHPWTDAGLAIELNRRYGAQLSRRSVADLRGQLGVPASHGRAAGHDYVRLTAAFSPLYPLTLEVLQREVPTTPGLYEIRADAPDMPAAPHGVIYIGSAIDLRGRLTEHLRGNSRNSLLQQYLGNGTPRLRYRLVYSGWRAREKELYHTFRATFGAPPVCNRMSP